MCTEWLCCLCLQLGPNLDDTIAILASAANYLQPDGTLGPNEGQCYGREPGWSAARAYAQ